MRGFDRNRLRNLRKIKGYSLEMTARLISLRFGISLSRSAISHWETGKSNPSLESLIAISDLFNVPLDYFFTLKTNKLFDGEENQKEGGER